VKFKLSAFNKEVNESNNESNLEPEQVAIIRIEPTEQDTCTIYISEDHPVHSSVLVAEFRDGYLHLVALNPNSISKLHTLGVKTRFEGHNNQNYIHHIQDNQKY
jgi:diacylglycerol kinase family enzyme